MMGKDQDQEDYLNMQALCFGAMDPCDWAATLSTNLLGAAQFLRAARDCYNDPTKDLTQFTDVESLAAIRSGVGEFLSQMFLMLRSMPMMQSQPQILESLQFIIAAVADIDRGNRAEWLVPVSTKKHPKRLQKEAEWVPIIAALELLLLDARFVGLDRAAKEIAKRTGRKLGTIKNWYQRLCRDGKRERPTAWRAIEEERYQIQTLLTLAEKGNRTAIIERRIAELLE